MIRKLWFVGLALAVVGWAPSVFAQGAKDAKMTLKAQKALYKEAGLIQVDVQSMMGMIYVRGTVASEEASKKAATLAKIKGAKEVRNRIKVGEVDIAAAGDDQIKSKIAEVVAGDEDLSKSKLDISVAEGNVKIEGKVSDYTVAGTLISDLRKIDGVKSIDFDKLKY
jgi:osmotically-inducible protein OsmY